MNAPDNAYPASFLKVVGEHAQRFLQGQLTCDVAALSPGQTTPGACCDLKGRVLGFFDLNRQSDTSFLLRCQPGIAQSLAEHLQRYKVFFKCDMQAEDGRVATDAQQTGLAVTLPHTGQQEYWQVGAQLPDSESCLCPAWFMRWHERLVPRVGLAIAGQHTPQALGLTRLGAVSFNKGCYTGQEIVARMHYRGKSQKTLMRFIARLDTEPTQIILPPIGSQTTLALPEARIEWVDILQEKQTLSLLGIADTSLFTGIEQLNAHPLGDFTLHLQTAPLP